MLFFFELEMFCGVFFLKNHPFYKIIQVFYIYIYCKINVKKIINVVEIGDMSDIFGMITMN